MPKQFEKTPEEQQNKTPEQSPEQELAQSSRQDEAYSNQSEQLETEENPSFFAEKKATVLAFIKYPRIEDFRSALYSILFMVSTSWWFARIPKLPFALLVLIPFFYLSVLGIVLVLAGRALEQSFSESKIRVFQKLFAYNGVITRYCRKDGERFLHAAFGVGSFLLVGSLYYAIKYEQTIAWFLLPLILLAMVAQFSLSQHMRGNGSRGSVYKMILHRSPYIIALVLAMYGIYYIFYTTWKAIPPLI